MTNAVIYARYSSTLQSESSIDAQLKACRAFCAERGYTVAAEYIDRAESASTTERTNFKRLMADAREIAYHVIVTHKLDRLSRSVTDIMLIMRELNARNIQYASVSEQFDFTTPVGKIILAVLAALAEWYLTNLKAEINKGKHERASKGLSNASTPPFGYSRSPEKGTIPDEYAPHVIWAFTNYAAGLVTYQGIADEFNRRGLVTTRGGPWNVDNVREMIQNPFYAGWVSERGLLDELAPSGKRRRVPRSRRRLYRGTHEPIISQDLFDKCAAVRIQRGSMMTSRRPKRVEQYLFSGLATCVHCDCIMRAGSRPDGKYKNYLCNSRRMGRDCKVGRRYVTETALLPQVEVWISHFNVPETVEQRALEIRNTQAAKVDYRKRIRALEAEMKRVNQMYQKGNIAEAVYDREVARIKHTINALEKPVDVPAAIEKVLHFAEIWPVADEIDRAAILHALLERVLIDADTKKIVKFIPRPEFVGLLPEII